MKRHDRAHVIFQRERYIRRRLALARQIFFQGVSGEEYEEWLRRNAGRLSKWNLVCSCPLCRDPKYREGRVKEKKQWQKETEVDVL